ncbi:MAG: hypothetical protein QHC40_10650 [Sphingobium sp.]|nr:hypothetical protein [Sphingobium sp.]
MATLGALASPAWAVPPTASEPAVETILVANQTQAPLACRMRGEASDWTAYQTIAPEFALSVPAEVGGTSYLECKAPVSPTIYAMAAGQKYVLIREKAGEPVELRSAPAPASKN